MGLAAAAMAAILAACSSSGSGGDSVGPASGGNTATANKSPLKVLIAIEDFGYQQDLRAGAAAAVKAVNASGGVQGHPLQVVYCDHQTADNNTAGTCVSNALKDSSVVAAADFRTTASSVTTPLLNNAKLACLGCQMYGPADFNSPMFFPDQAGFLSIPQMVVMADKVVHASRVAVPFNSQTGAALPGLAGAAKPAGLDIVPLPINASQTDLSSTAAVLISNKPGAIIQSSALGTMLKLLFAAQSQGAAIPLIMTSNAVSPASVTKVLKGITSPIYILSVVNRESAGYKDFTNDMKKYAPEQDLTDTASSGWRAIKMLLAKDVVGAIGQGEITRASVLNAANTLSSVDTEGMVGPIDWTKPTNLLGGKVTRGFNNTAYGYKYENGQFVRIGEAFNPFSG